MVSLQNGGDTEERIESGRRKRVVIEELDQ